MRFLLSIIAALGGLCWAMVAVYKSGFDIGSLNPFLWRRRYQNHSM
ncbi:MAG: hypothetical protein O6852_09935 [Gammaproteobacteria bacterium]|nr:hypothetical protein [Gammaproteobacteria bacterium]